MSKPSSCETVVVGAGLAGLVAAAVLSRAGSSVRVLERATTLGGRAHSQRRDGYVWNWGPHALYRSGEASRILGELGIRLSGATPDASGGYALWGGRTQTLPGGLVSLLTTGLLGVTGKIELARLLGSLPKLDASAWDGRTVEEFVASRIRDERVGQLYLALVRLTTYANAPRLMCAGAALRQLQLALATSVLYLDGGWQTMVDGLVDTIRDHGGELETGVRVAAVDTVAGRDGGHAVCGVRLADGSRVQARQVVLATPPAAAAALARASGEALAFVADAAQATLPIRAACLDLALRSLPRPANRFALGIDTPHYFSVHSAYAALAPMGGAVVHVARYLAPDESGDDVRAELEEVVDLMQPGWRDLLVDARYLPALAVTGAVVEARLGGLTGRPASAVSPCAGLYLAGDWIGPAGMLADAAVASADAAARSILVEPRSRSRRAA
jgi:phytoene dehydrogenase-like protein